MCAEQGTRLWAKASTDPELLARVDGLTAEQIAELREAGHEEPHRGYTPLRAEIRNLIDQVIAVRGLLARVKPSELSFMPRPKMFADRLAERESELVRGELDSIIAQAHAAYERLNPDRRW